jgi:hypothetical protein
LALRVAAERAAVEPVVEFALLAAVAVHAVEPALRVAAAVHAAEPALRVAVAVHAAELALRVAAVYVVPGPLVSEPAVAPVCAVAELLYYLPVFRYVSP